MQWKIPKNTDKYQWTLHVTEKMRYYGLSEQKVLGVIRRPQRIETGIATDTVAAMLPVGNIGKNRKPRWGKPTFAQGYGMAKSSFASAEASADTWNQEIWVMYQLKSKSLKSKVESLNENPEIAKLQKKINTSKKITIISAWRYPGVSPKNNPIPAEILREIEELGLK